MRSTVTQLTAAIEKAIKTGVPASITVRGEVSNVSDRQASGHLYFTMKDSGASINCVMWRDNAARLQFRLEDGLEIIATGRVTVYAPQGRYQLTVQQILPAGRGALELAFRQLQARLSAEGLFDADRKKTIPQYPTRIVLLTSRATAALQDMLKVLRRFPWLKLMVYHVPVQGDGSAAKIAAAIDHLSRHAADIGGVDVILLARGGGSLEDLWSFNEEIVARAIAASRIPVITGIGHEVDCSISDLVADYHAHTPTEAAQVVSQHWKRAADSLSQAQTRLRNIVRQTAARLSQSPRGDPPPRIFPPPDGSHPVASPASGRPAEGHHPGAIGAGQALSGSSRGARTASSGSRPLISSNPLNAPGGVRSAGCRPCRRRPF